MALTVAVSKVQIIGTSKLVIGTATFDSSYLTGGELFPPSLLGLYALSSVDCGLAGLDATHAILVGWNQLQGATSTLKAYWGDNANASPASLIEVASTTNLAALVVPFEARGA